MKIYIKAIKKEYHPSHLKHEKVKILTQNNLLPMPKVDAIKNIMKENNGIAD